jgi:S-DNA-T family DNA segregation ATPase FtsK/SpoIIIE
MRKKLEFQADRIEAVLSLHQIPARVTGGTITPRWVRFQVLPAIGAKIARIKGLSEELAAALDARNCRVSRRGAAVDVEVPRDDPQPVRLMPLLDQLGNDSAIPPITATLGIAEDGSPLLIRLPSPDVAHTLVAGTTGSGKTVLLKTMILSLALNNAPPHPDRHRAGEALSLILIDPKGHPFAPFRHLPHLARPIIREIDEAVEALQSLVRLMERCESAGGQAHVVLIIDELADILMTGGKPIQQALTRLTQRGREANIHVVAATQKPSNDILGPLIKSNFPARIVGMVTSASDARTATGWTGTGAERLLGKGDFLAVAEGQLTRFQAAHVSQEEIEAAVADLCARLPAARQTALPWPMREYASEMET